MKKECEMASLWWAQQLTKSAAGQSASNNSPLSYDCLTVFQKTLEEMMSAKYENHWYPIQPDRGHAYRSIMCDRRVIDNLLLAAAKSAHIPNLRERFSEAELIMWVDPGCVKVQYSHAPKSPHTVYQSPNALSGEDSIMKSSSVPNSPTILSLRMKGRDSSPILAPGERNSVTPNSGSRLVPRHHNTTTTSGSLITNTLRSSLLNNLNNAYPERVRSPNHHNTLFIPNYNNQQYQPGGNMYYNMSSNHHSFENGYAGFSQATSVVQ